MYKDRLKTAGPYFVRTAKEQNRQRDRMQRLRIDTACSSFRRIRENGYCYVDKTDFIEEFLGNGPLTATLITRPRRFGKSMTMSMLAEFFDITKDSRALFDGLKIAANRELCEKWMNAWPVLYLSLKDIKGPSLDTAMFQFSTLAGDLCAGHLYLLESSKVGMREKKHLQAIYDGTASIDETGNVVHVLLRALAQQYSKEVILIIDEYDVPVAKAQEHGYYADMKLFWQNALGCVLKENACLEFAVLAGCFPLPVESSYTGLNNIICYDVSASSYADKIGFTNEDVDRLLSYTNLSHAKNDLRDWYDGYCFGDKKEMYCPWDVLHYITDLQKDPQSRPLPYWINSGKNDEVRRCIEKSDKVIRKKLYELLHEGSVRTAVLNEALTYDSIDYSDNTVWTLLYLTGYLTKVQGKNCSHGANDITLRIPNKEIHAIFSMYIDLWARKSVEKIDLGQFLDAFWKGDAEALTQALSSVILKSLSCFDVYREYWYHALLTGIFYSQHYTVSSNSECGHGFADLVIVDEDNGRAAVVEVKQTKDLQRLPSLCNDALEQINRNKYDINIKEYGTVLHWGLAFCMKNVLAQCRTIS